MGASTAGGPWDRVRLKHEVARTDTKQIINQWGERDDGKKGPAAGAQRCWGWGDPTQPVRFDLLRCF